MLRIKKRSLEPLRKIGARMKKNKPNTSYSQLPSSHFEAFNDEEERLIFIAIINIINLNYYYYYYFFFLAF